MHRYANRAFFYSLSLFTPGFFLPFVKNLLVFDSRFAADRNLNDICYRRSINIPTVKGC
jgi:hypothetical protein